VHLPKSIAAYTWRRRIASRLLLLLTIAVFIGLGWWPVPWSIYAALALPSLLLYGLLWWPKFTWLGSTHIVIDLSMLALLVRYTGGTSSLFDTMAYIWFFGTVLLYMRRAQTVRFRLPLFAALAFVALVAGAWGFPNWLPFLSFHAFGLTLTSLLGVTLLGERARNAIDPLTKVLHRAAGLEQLDDKLAQGLPFVLAFVDLRGFKAINDRYGHAVGDEVISSVAKRIAKGLRQDDVALRYGGDEFVVASEASALSSRLEQLFVHPVQTSAGVIQVQADIGEVSRIPEESLESLLNRADGAMYAKKHKAYGAAREAGIKQMATAPRQAATPNPHN
jgi:diguanylate cyclase (GGDEF)-like protein